MHALTIVYTWLGLSTGVELDLRSPNFWDACGPQQSALPLTQQAAQCMETIEIRMTCKCDAIAGVPNTSCVPSCQLDFMLSTTRTTRRTQKLLSSSHQRLGYDWS